MNDTMLHPGLWRLLWNELDDEIVDALCWRAQLSWCFGARAMRLGQLGDFHCEVWLV